MKNIINVNVSRKNQVVNMLDDKISPNNWKDILTKPLVVQLYSEALNQLRQYNGDQLNTLDFDALVLEVMRLLNVGQALISLRETNSANVYSATIEKSKDEVKQVLKNIFYKLDTEKLSIPENIVLASISDSYVGSDYYDICDLYDPVNDSSTKVDSLITLFKLFPFEKYVSEKETIRINNLFDSKTGLVNDFRKIKAAAGSDIVNWGPHKYAAQGKKLNIDCNYIIQNWGDKLSKHIIASGVQVVEKKKTSSQKLIEKRDRNSELTQVEALQLFKITGEASCHEVIDKYMTVETATSLLTVTTKNVQDKLSFYPEASKSIRSIVQKILAEYNPDAFNKLKEFFKSKQKAYVSWHLLEKYVGQYSIEEMTTWINENGIVGEGAINSDNFYEQVIKHVPVEHKLTLDAYITDEVIKRMSKEEKNEFLQNYVNLPKVMERLGRDGYFYAIIWWEVSARLFFDCDYTLIKNVIEYADIFDEFSEKVIAENDTQFALAEIKDSRSWRDKTKLFSILSFDQKLDALKNSNTRSDMNKIFNKNELSEFIKIALVDKDLCNYLQDIDINNLDKLVENEHRFLFVPAIMHGQLSQKNIVKVFKHGKFLTSMYLNHDMKNIYARLSRSDFDSISERSPVTHPDAKWLGHIMTESELCEYADRDKKFLRDNINLIPASYFERFKDKEFFKGFVGDRRNKFNNKLANAIEGRIAA